MYNFSNKAKETILNSSKVIENHAKVTTDDLISAYPAGCTISAVDLIHGEKGDYAVFNIAERADVYSNGGKVLTSIVKAWADDFGGDIAALNNELRNSGGVKVVLSKSRTKKGQTFTKVDIT